MRSVLLFLMLVVTGCASTGGKVDSSVVAMSNVLVSIQDVSHDHVHSNSAVAVGFLVGGVVGALVAEGLSDEPFVKDESYIDKVNAEVTNVLVGAVAESESFDVTQEDSSNQLKITIDYGFAANSVFQKSPVALLTKWVLRDGDGKQLFKIVTKVKAVDAPDDTPSSIDPKYYETFLLLAKQSGEDFNLLIQGKPAKWGAKDFRFTN